VVSQSVARKTFKAEIVTIIIIRSIRIQNRVADELAHHLTLICEKASKISKILIHTRAYVRTIIASKNQNANKKQRSTALVRKEREREIYFRSLFFVKIRGIGVEHHRLNGQIRGVLDPVVLLNLSLFFYETNHLISKSKSNY
jgi:hypothetical protein